MQLHITECMERGLQQTRESYFLSKKTPLPWGYAAAAGKLKQLRQLSTSISCTPLAGDRNSGWVGPRLFVDSWEWAGFCGVSSTTSCSEQAQREQAEWSLAQPVLSISKDGDVMPFWSTYSMAWPLPL